MSETTLIEQLTRARGVVAVDYILDDGTAVRVEKTSDLKWRDAHGRVFDDLHHALFHIAVSDQIDLSELIDRLWHR